MIIKNAEFQIISIEKFAASCHKTYVFICWERIMPYFIEYVVGLEIFSFFITFQIEEEEDLISFTNFYKHCTFVYPTNIHFPHLQQCALQPNCIMFNCEQMTIPERRQMTEQFLKQGGKLFDYNIENCRILWTNFSEEQVLCLPYRCNEQERSLLVSLLTKEQKKYDAAVVASWTPRRQEIVKSLQDAGLNICIIKDTFGIERDRLIAQSKCLLNIHANENYHIFETLRCFRWLDAGHTVISEPCIGSSINSSKQHPCLKIVETANLAHTLLELQPVYYYDTKIDYEGTPLNRINGWLGSDNCLCKIPQISFCYGANDRFTHVDESLPFNLSKKENLNQKYGDPKRNVKKHFVLIFGEAIMRLPEERNLDYVITAEKNVLHITALET